MKAAEHPELKSYVGQDLIVTDGTSVLGSDNKAAIANVMTALHTLASDSNLYHGDIYVAFVPDEECGLYGSKNMDFSRFPVDFAYTIDGGGIGELEYENFNAASAKIEIQGKKDHPGTAKNVMIISLRVAGELDAMLPGEQKPEYTEGYEGFLLLTHLNGTVDHTSMSYIIRDHSTDKFEQKKTLMRNAVAFLNTKYGAIITLSITDSYYNMRGQIEPHIEIIDLAKKSMEEIGITPIIHPIRGGTDGARLSFMGLPCPNIFAGGFNFHGRFECIPVSSIYKGIDLLIRIIENAAK